MKVKVTSEGGCGCSMGYVGFKGHRCGELRMRDTWQKWHNSDRLFCYLQIGPSENAASSRTV
ncbi:uncharacterized protein DS421_10g304700 [Arachis hypogaea]|nr:uncharacterized protein DS421_10g304700 [Arachis hypogaea]